MKIDRYINGLAHKRLVARRFFGRQKDVFIKRGDGTSWPRWQNTLRSGRAYYEGLLRPGRRKNMESISARMNIDNDRLERFIRESPWEYEALQEHLVANIPECILDSKAVILVDDVGLIKQGKHSVGVQRQYSGALGKVGNCQVGVDAVYVAPGKKRNADQRTWPLGMRLYLPEKWADDRVRRTETNVPDDVVFKTKPQIALEMIDKIRAHKVEHKAIVADAGYGDSSDFRKELRDHEETYVLGVTPSSLRVIDPSVPLTPPGSSAGRGRRRKFTTYPEGTIVQSPAVIADGVKEWTIIKWSEGTKGVLSGEFYRTKVRVTEDAVNLRHATDEIAWLLLERRKDELKAHLCWGLDDSSLEELVGLAHLRWPIEQFHKEAKQLLGLDRFEGRSWKGWHHHVTMVLLAYAFLSLLRAQNSQEVKLPSLRTTARAVVQESATQTLMREHKLKRPEAAPIATTMIRGYTDW